jgi:drug/metabolite transporter (DMT)-like permease
MGTLLVVASAAGWAAGSFLVRLRGKSSDHLTAAAYQMLIGGIALAMVGLLLGESNRLGRESFTETAIFAFFYLLIVGSLIGFVSLNWLLGHVSAALAGTYSYVNPMVAILVGWQFGNEELSKWVIAGMLVIFAGVALVRFGGIRPRELHPRHATIPGREEGSGLAPASVRA